MKPRAPVDKQKARLVKQLLWQGKSQARINAVTGVSQSTVSRIKSGQAHEDVPWPDGSVGEMSARQVIPESDWSADAQRFLSFPDELQERMHKKVNKRREEMGLLPVPTASTAFTSLMESELGDLEWEATAIADAHKAEDARLASIMIEFDEILEVERATQRGEQTISIIESTREDRSDEPAIVPSDVLIYTKMDWKDLIHQAPDIPIVKRAFTSSDVALKESCCILFHELRGTPSSWGEPAVEKQILLVADKIRANIKLMLTLEEEYKD